MQDFSAENGVLSDLSVAEDRLSATLTLTPDATIEDTANVVSLTGANFTDAAGNLGTGTGTSNSYAVDTVSPTVAITVVDLSNQISPIITGTAEADSVVTLTISGATYSAITSNFGVWSVNTSEIPPTSGSLNVIFGGNNTLTAISTDAAGNQSNPFSQSFHLAAAETTSVAQGLNFIINADDADNAIFDGPGSLEMLGSPNSQVLNIFNNGGSIIETGFGADQINLGEDSGEDRIVIGTENVDINFLVDNVVLGEDSQIAARAYTQLNQNILAGGEDEDVTIAITRINSSLGIDDTQVMAFLGSTPATLAGATDQQALLATSVANVTLGATNQDAVQATSVANVTAGATNQDAVQATSVANVTLGATNQDAVQATSVANVTAGASDNQEASRASSVANVTLGATNQDAVQATSVANVTAGATNQDAVQATSVANVTAGATNQDAVQATSVANVTAGATNQDAVQATSVANVAAGSDGTQTATYVLDTAAGVSDQQRSFVSISGVVEAGDVFSITIDAVTFSYTAIAGDGLNNIRDALIDRINNDSPGVVPVTASSPGGLGQIELLADADNTPFTGSAVATNSAAVEQVDTVTISNIEEGDSFTITVNGTAFTYTATAGDANEDAVRDGLIGLINANTSLPVTATAATGGAGVVTLTADSPGTAFTATATDSNRAALEQVDTVTISNIEEGDSFTITVNGTAFTYTATAGDANEDAVRDGLIGLINANTSLPVTATAATGGAGVVTLTADSPGTAFTATATDSNRAALEQVDTVTISNIEEGDSFTITVNGTAFTYTATAGDANEDAVRDGLIGLINANTSLPVTATAATGGAGVVTLTADSPGTAFTATATDSNRAALEQVDTVTISNIEEGDSFTITVNGTAFTYTATAGDANEDAVRDGLIGLINANTSLPVTATAATGGAGVVTLTADSPGTAFTATATDSNRAALEQVDTVTISNIEEGDSFTITVNGTAFTYTATAGDANEDAVRDGLIGLINANTSLPVTATAATGGAGVVTLTADSPGTAFTATATDSNRAALEQVDTVTISNIEEGDSFTITVNGTAFTYTATAGDANEDAVRDGLIGLINANTSLPVTATAATGGAGVVTLTADSPGTAFTATATDSNRAALEQVDTVTISNIEEGDSFTITVNGTAFTYTATAGDANEDAVRDGLIGLINANTSLPVTATAATGGAGVVTLTADSPGTAFTATATDSNRAALEQVDTVTISNIEEGDSFTITVNGTAFTYTATAGDANEDAVRDGLIGLINANTSLPVTATAATGGAGVVTLTADSPGTAFTATATDSNRAALEQVDTVTISNIEEGDSFTITVNGTAFTYTATAGDANEDAVRDGLIGLINANTSLPVTATAATGGAGVVTLTADSPGTAFTATATDSNRAALEQVDTVTISNIEEGDSFTITVNGTAFTYTATAGDANEDAVRDGLIGLINANTSLPVTATAATGGAGVVTLTADSPGTAFTATATDSNRAGTEQIDLISIAGNVEAGDTYTATINGVAYTYTSSAGQTLTQVRNGLIDVINDPVTGSSDVTASASGGVGGITLTAKQVGIVITLSVQAQNAQDIAQFDTITLSGTYEIGDAIQVTVNGNTVTYTVVLQDLSANGDGTGGPVAGNSTTALNNIRANLITEINNSGTVAPIVTAAAGVTDRTVTLTATAPGTAFTASVTSVNRAALGIDDTQVMAFLGSTPATLAGATDQQALLATSVANVTLGATNQDAVQATSVANVTAGATNQDAVQATSVANVTLGATNQDAVQATSVANVTAGASDNQEASRASSVANVTLGATNQDAVQATSVANVTAGATNQDAVQATSVANVTAGATNQDAVQATSVANVTAGATNQDAVQATSVANVTAGATNQDAVQATSVANVAAGSDGTQTATYVLDTAAGVSDQQRSFVSISGVVEAGDVFSITIDAVTFSYTAIAGDGLNNIRDALIDRINNDSPGVVPVTASSPGGLGQIELLADADNTPFTGSAVATNSAAVEQVDTVTISNIEEGDSFTITVNGTAFTYTATAGDANEDAVRDGLIGLINANTSLPVTATAATGGAGVVTLTADSPGTAFTATATDSNRAALEQVDTVTISNIEEGDSFTITVNGTAFTYTATAGDANEDAVRDGLIGLINANTSLPVTATAATGGAGVVTLTADSPGTAFTATATDSNRAALEQVDTVTISNIEEGDSFTITVNGTAFTYTATAGDANEDAVRDGLIGLINANTSLPVTATAATGGAGVVTLTADSPGTAFTATATDSNRAALEQVDTVTISNIEEGDSFTITVNGTAFTYTATAGDANEDAVRDGLIGLINANTSLPVTATAATGGAGVVTLTADSPGTAFTATATDSNRAALEQVDTVTISNIEEGDSFTITVNGTAFTYTATAGDANEDAVRDGLIGLINANTSLPVTATAATGGAGVVTLTADSPGTAFTATATDSNRAALEQVDTVTISNIEEGDSFTITVNGTAFTYTATAGDANEDAVRDGLIGLINANTSLPVTATAATGGAGVVTLTADSPGTAFTATATDSNRAALEQVDTVTISNIEEGDSFTITVNGTAFTYTATAGDANEDAVRDGLIGLINANTSLPVTATAATGGAGVVTLTADSPGTAFTATATDSNRAALEQVDTVTISNIEEGDSFTITVNGTAFTYTATAGDANEDAVRDGLIGLINANTSLPVTATAATGGAGVVTLTADSPGTAFTATATDSNRAALEQVDTVTISNIEEGDSFTITVNGTAFTYTATAGDANEDAVRDGLIGLINANTSLPVTATAATGGAGVVTLTADSPGTAFTATATDSNRAALEQVDTVTISNIEEGDSFTITVNGTAFTYTATAGDANEDAVRDGLIGLINANTSLPVTATAATGGAGVVTLTADSPGTAFTATATDSNRAGTEQIDLISIAGNVEAGDTYTATINGVAYTYTSSAGQTLTQVRNGLIDVINDPVTGSSDVTASASGGVGGITLTAKQVGIVITLSVQAQNAQDIAQFDTITLSGTYEIGDAIQVTVNGNTVTYTVVLQDLSANGDGTGGPVAGNSTTALNNIRANLITEINNSGTVAPIVTAAAGVTDRTVTLTATAPGTAFLSEVNTGNVGSSQQQVQVTILEVPDDSISVSINGTEFIYDVLPGDTVEQIRDALVNAITLGSEPVSASNGVTADVFIITADSSGTTFSISANDSPALLNQYDVVTNFQPFFDTLSIDTSSVIKLNGNYGQDSVVDDVTTAASSIGMITVSGGVLSFFGLDDSTQLFIDSSAKLENALRYLANDGVIADNEAVVFNFNFGAGNDAGSFVFQGNPAGDIGLMLLDVATSTLIMEDEQIMLSPFAPV
ncbi:MAG: hypothetical protein KFB94_07370 [Methylophilaceae bacterium]|nr:MAG: hypothetical protein KFB94_07370 [Methylophilaceae bacterium]